MYVFLYFYIAKSKNILKLNTEMVTNKVKFTQHLNTYFQVHNLVENNFMPIKVSISVFSI